jgi:N-acetylglucosamine malate deacetylase 1
MKLDIMVMAVHPDDAELACAGTMAHQMSLGNNVGIIEFTKGELGTRGTPEIRLAEAEESSKILGINIRENLGFKDGFFKNDEEHQKKIIQKIRKYRPEIVLTNALEDRHPDHGRACQLAIDACFYSGLRMIETQNDDGSPQEAWRPKNVYNYIQDRYIEPDFVIDITPFWEVKIASIKAFGSQFFNPKTNEPKSYISSSEFLEFIEGRSKEMGHKIGVLHGEGFTNSKMMGVKNLFDVY